MNTPLSNHKSIQRGDIVAYDFGKNSGSVQNGIRPAVVVQVDTRNRTSPTTIIAPITTVLKKTSMSSHVVIGKKYGLREESMILLEQIRVVNQVDLLECIGTIKDMNILNQIDKGLQYLFGIRSRKNTRTVKCLCSKCLQKLISRKTSYIRRVDSFDKNSYTCDWCGAAGNKYFVMYKHNNKTNRSPKHELDS